MLVVDLGRTLQRSTATCPTRSPVFPSARSATQSPHRTAPHRSGHGIAGATSNKARLPSPITSPRSSWISSLWHMEENNAICRGDCVESLLLQTRAENEVLTAKLGTDAFRSSFSDLRPGPHRSVTPPRSLALRVRIRPCSYQRETELLSPFHSSPGNSKTEVKSGHKVYCWVITL